MIVQVSIILHREFAKSVHHAALHVVARTQYKPRFSSLHRTTVTYGYILAYSD